MFDSWDSALLERRLDTAIIAGSDDDVTVDEMLDYIKPVLKGMDPGRWIACCFETQDGETLSVRVTTELGSLSPASYGFDQAKDLKEFRSDFPVAAGLVVVLLAQYAPQVYQLLDGVSGWLAMMEVSHPSLQPFVEILEDLKVPL
jgi:hypothetical protein